MRRIVGGDRPHHGQELLARRVGRSRKRVVRVWRVWRPIEPAHVSVEQLGIECGVGPVIGSTSWAGQLHRAGQIACDSFVECSVATSVHAVEGVPRLMNYYPL